MELKNSKYDVVILGGGMAGLTLALQLVQENSSVSILIIEKRKNNAPEAIHKVGESIVELSAHYLRKDLGLKSYLAEKHLPKFGFRYFFDSKESTGIEQRIEVGSRTKKQAPSHHIDRGVFENDLLEIVKEKGVSVWLDSQIMDVELSKNGHRSIVEKQSKKIVVDSKWVVDATGRRSFLKRKLNLNQELNHKVSAVWFRLSEEIDVHDWSEDKTWKSHLPPDFRRLSTNHFMGNGYWLWIIPLVNGNTSIGIVASQEHHAFQSINTLDKAFEWIESNEPLVAERIRMFKSRVLDFKVLKNYAHDTKQFFSSDKWCITGEAGVFLDPFYSPGTDFIALSNTWISDLILRDLKNEDISFRVNLYEHTQRQLIDGWYSLYKDLYSCLSGSRVLLSKIIWDWSTYWSILTPLFIHKGFTDIDVMKAYASNKNKLGQRFNELNENLQKLFKHWSSFDQEILEARYINVFDLDFLYKFHFELQDRLDNEKLIERLRANLSTLEIIAAEIFRKAYAVKYEKALSDGIDPYTMDLAIDQSWINKISIAPNDAIKKDLAMLWNDTSNKKQLKPHVDRQKQVEEIFIDAKNLAENTPNLNELYTHLESYAGDFKSVAYEGASFAIGLKCIEQNNLNTWFEFKQEAEEIHFHHILIGFGWAFAALQKRPSSFEEIKNNSSLMQLIHSGIGYYNALYKVKKTMRELQYPNYIDEQNSSSFDEGVGRRIWYYTDGEPDRIVTAIDKFPASRKKNLWRGVGLACGYVGEASTNHLKDLSIKVDKYHIDFSTGIVTSAVFNLKDNRNIEGTLGACSIIAGLSKDEITKLSLEVKDKKEASTLELMKIIESNIHTLYHNHEN